MTDGIPDSPPTRYTHRHQCLTDAQIVALYAELQDSTTVGQRAGVSAITVLNRVRAAGAPVRVRGGLPGRRVAMAFGDDEVVRRYAAGASAREVAGAAGCGVHVVYRVLLRAGVERRTGGPPPRRKT